MSNSATTLHLRCTWAADREADRRGRRRPQAARSEAYVYLGEHIALAFTDDDVTDTKPPKLANCYLHGPYIDELLADEQVGIEASTSSHLIWPLGDHLGTIRDLAERDLVSGLTVVVSHMTLRHIRQSLAKTPPTLASVVL